jgi:hypothetical protein
MLKKIAILKKSQLSWDGWGRQGGHASAIVLEWHCSAVLPVLIVGAERIWGAGSRGQPLIFSFPLSGATHSQKWGCYSTCRNFDHGHELPSASTANLQSE